MSERQMGVERVFNLGQYKSIRLSETITFDDEKLSKEQIDALRILLLLDVYQQFGTHKLLMDLFNNDNVDDGQGIIDIVLAERDRILSEAEGKDG